MERWREDPLQTQNSNFMVMSVVPAQQVPDFTTKSHTEKARGQRLDMENCALLKPKTKVDAQELFRKWTASPWPPPQTSFQNAEQLLLVGSKSNGIIERRSLSLERAELVFIPNSCIFYFYDEREQSSSNEEPSPSKAASIRPLCTPREEW